MRLELKRPCLRAGVVLLLVLAAGTVPATAQSDCELLEGQLLTNCGFETGDPPEGWMLSWGTEFQQTGTSSSGLYAASAIGEESGFTYPPFINLESDCFPLPDRSMTFGMVARRDALTTCYASLDGFSDPSCEDYVGGLRSETIRFEGGEWTPVVGVGFSPGPFGRVLYHCRASFDLDEPFLIDDAFVVAQPEVVDVPANRSAALVGLASVLALAGALLLQRGRRRLLGERSPRCA